ncbi:MAG: diadenylate cyclase CdaA [Bacillota bacterium]
MKPVGSPLWLLSASWVDWLRYLVDIAVVALIFYWVFRLVRGTRAVQLIKGIVVLFVAGAVSDWLELTTLKWLFDQAQIALLVALPVVFQPELRRVLEQLGRGSLFGRDWFVRSYSTKALDEVARAVASLSREKVGALIVLERATRLGEYVETGIRLDAAVSSELLVNLFIPNTPLHDGAVIVSGDRVLAAACFLPLAEATRLGTELGARHRAAVGISERSDAVAVVVSEETGQVAVASDGKLVRNVDPAAVREMLDAFFPSETRFLRRT